VFNHGIAAFSHIVEITMKQIWLRGANGVGKSTLGRIIEQRLIGSVFVSSGNLLRANMSDRKQLQDEMAKGDLANSDLVIRVMHKRFEELKIQGANLLILDGFPRKVEELLSWMEMTNPPDLVVTLRLEDDDIVARLVNRQICDTCGRSYNSYSNEFLRPILPRVHGKCDLCSDGKLVRRPEDLPEIVRKRLSLFHGNEKYIMDALKRHSQVKLRTYDVSQGLASFERISNDVSTLIR